MENLIVSKFYSKLEKIGMKKHIPSDIETDYIKRFNKIEQCDLLCKELDYNKKISKIKDILYKSFLILITILTFLFLQYQLYTVSIIGIVFAILFIILINKNKLDFEIFNIQKSIFSHIEDIKIKDTFK